MSLIGRDAELARIEAWLEDHDDDARVLSVVGPTGIGASRLVEEALRRLREREPERAAWRCAVGDAGAGDAVAAALGAPDVAGVRAALAGASEPVLFVDGGARDDVRAELGAWLDAAPDACVIVACGARLDVPGETIVALGPLPEAASLELLLDAARRAGAPIEERDRAIAEEIARAAEGLPLAIELAARRLPIFGARALLHRMRTQPAAAGDPLERALEAAWRTLSEAERVALARATVLRGAFDVATAEAVLDLPDAAEHLAALHARGLVVAEAPGAMRLSPAARAFAAARLAPEEREAARTRHAEHFAARAEAADRAWLAGAREDLLAVVGGVLDASAPLTPRRAAPALRVLVCALPVLYGAAPVGRWRALIDPVLAATRASGVDGLLVARVLAARGALRRAEGARAGTDDLVRALGMVRAMASPDAARAVELARAEADVLGELGRALADAGQDREAIDHFERARALAQRAGDLGRQGDAYAGEAVVRHRALDLTQAGALLERAAALHERDPLALAEDLRALADVRVDQADHAAARACATRALEASEALGDRRGVALARAAFGALQHDAGDLRAARASLEDAATRLGALGLERDRAAVVARLGVLARAEGRAAEAYALLSEALSRLGEADRERAAILAAHLAALEHEAGRGERARVMSAGLSAEIDRARMPVAAHVAMIVAAQVEARDLGPARAAVDAVASSSAAVRAAIRAGARAPRPSVVTPDALVVAEDGTWFRAPGAERVGLERRRPLARLLSALARARLDAPGRAVTTPELFAAAWKGEKVLAAAGAHRVRVGVATLRKMGLKDALRTSGDGYLLEPSLPILLA